MQLLFHSPALTDPTFDTLKEYGTLRFEKLSKYLPKFDGEHTVRVSVKKERYLFVVTVEVVVPNRLIVKTRNNDLRHALDEAFNVMKVAILKDKEKRRG